MFKVALWDQWLVIMAGPKMTDDLRRRPDDEVNFIEGSDEVRCRFIARISLISI